MQSKSVIVLLAFCALARAASMKRSLLLERTISNMLMKSMEALASDAPNTTACFNVYWPQVEGLIGVYEETYNGCITTADAARESVQNDFAADRAIMTAASQEICNEYQNCNDGTTAMGFFACYSDSSDQAAKTSTSIAFTATEALEKVKQCYSVIDGEEAICTETCTYQYQTDMVKALEELDACNKGKVTPA